MNDHDACQSYRDAMFQKRALDRRSFLLAGSLGLVGWLAAPKTALAQMALRPEGEPEGDALVVIFLRGGMDGLNAVAPYAEEDYYRLRPTLALARPNDRTRAQSDRVIDLDGFFGLHSALQPLAPIFERGELGIVHAVGSGDQTRSHFEAMSAMERGLSGGTAGTSGGWLARYLQATAREGDTPMRAVSLTSTTPDSLLGATHAVNLYNVAEYRLDGEYGFRQKLAAMYGEGEDAISIAGRDTLDVLKKLDKLDPRAYAPSSGATYPDSELGQGLKQTAMLLKNGVGLEVACLDRGGWDTHVTQGAGTGWLASQLDDVGKSMAAFAADMGAGMKRTTVIAMTEFGRRVYENTGLGTDHGRGSCLFAMGGGVVGGKVHAKWPGLKEEQLEGPGDLRVTTDYRDVLGEALLKRSRLQEIGNVFLGHEPKPVGVFR